MAEQTISITDAFDLTVSILERHNTSPVNARHVAHALVSAEMSGQRGHGLSRVASYAAQSASGKVDGFAIPIVENRKSAAVRIDAVNGFAYPAMDLAISELVTLANDSGVGVATVFRSHHFGQAGYHVERLAKKGWLAWCSGIARRQSHPGVEVVVFLARTPSPLQHHGPMTFRC